MKLLLDSLTLSLSQISAILEQLQLLSKDKRNYLYQDLNIGNHVRHVIDHCIAVKDGISSGRIDYNNRNRGTHIESKSQQALNALNEFAKWVNNCEQNCTDKEMLIKSEIDCLQTRNQEFKSSLSRELLYLINHTIHHAAHIGLICKHQEVEIPLHTGMAPCTMSFLRTSIN